MRAKRISTRPSGVLAILIVAVSVATTCAATEKALHNFEGYNGFYPLTALISDGAGNLYGITSQGGAFNLGVVFELTPNGSGGWAARTLHSFGSGLDGASPFAGVTFDGAGNLYGTTNQGGTKGVGTVFEMSPNGGGWTEKVIHNFGISDTDGQNPSASLIFDGAGNLYGTTAGGGANNKGTVFEMTPDGNGEWTEFLLHNFGNGLDGQYPQAGLIFDGAGNLYGTTGQGGSYSCPIDVGCGTVFEMTPNGSGGWTERVLHNFGHGLDGTAPIASLIFDSAGNLYGPTNAGGTLSSGTVFEMTPNGSGGWTEKVLHNFGQGNDGVAAQGTLVFDGSGNLYGTTWSGGDLLCYGFVGCGTVFEMTPNGSGGWTEKVLHNFGHGLDGTHPGAGVIRDAAGNLYGTAEQGGDFMCTGHGCGIVYEVTTAADWP